MSENNNKAIRLRTTVNPKAGQDNNYVSIHLDQDYDTFEILSMSLNDTDAYKLHNSNYGVIAGRVIANGGFGVPNAKISVFIEADSENDSYEVISLYSYKNTSDKNTDGYKYNLLSDKPANECHQAVGSFPNKTYLLDNDVLLEVFDKYYKFTCRTNNSGDYMICGVPTGNHTLHMDLDISDCGILSQRPRDFVYKGYTIEQFENPNQFKKGKDFDGLSQIFSQDKVVYVQPFWGNDSLGETIGITRADIEVNFKFEPTCVFMGCAVSDAASNGISKKCIPTENMGLMEELTTGEGKIEMIRKTPGGNIEEFQIKGTALIDSNGVWCYQIPMNLDYMVTDEYGNMVPTDDPEIGIPTRTRVRFRLSLNDFEENANENNFFRGKVLIPHNPQDKFDVSGGNNNHEEYDYAFGTSTREDSFRDLFWNNVYTVKSYIPRFQKTSLWRSKKFSGIKGCNHSGTNNPIPYNNIRIRLPFMFVIMCALIKAYIRIVSFVNLVNNIIYRVNCWFATSGAIVPNLRASSGTNAKNATYVTIADGLCPDLETWYFAPMAGKDSNYCKLPRRHDVYYQADDLEVYAKDDGRYRGDAAWKCYVGGSASICEQTIGAVTNYDTTPDTKSIDNANTDPNSKIETSYCLTKNTDYLIACIEMNLAQEYKIINFDFYNDWINGMVYIPRWVRESRRKVKRIRTKNGIKKVYYDKIKGCMADKEIFGSTRYYTQQCALTYSIDNSTKRYTNITTTNGCTALSTSIQNCHKTSGLKRKEIFTNRGGIVQEEPTIRGQKVYYCKPCDWNSAGRKILLYANDLVLLGSLNDCSLYGIPQAFKWLSSSSYIMPTNLALTNMDTDSYVYAKSDGTFCTTSSPSVDDFSQTIKQKGNSYKEVGKYYSTLKDNKDVGYVGYGVSGITEQSSDNASVIVRPFQPFTDTVETNTEGIAGGRRVLKSASRGVDGGITPKFNQKLYYDDMIAVTEAAGIAWNYSGPGQGEPSTAVTKSLYYPGGHFLGLSCVNSQTNVKSCVNLQRICEMGANMSQRRQVVRKLDNDGNYSYTYFSPTGLISTDDISSIEFRSMFASMNMKRLIADKIDPNTGYKTYSFIYMRPNGFDGILKNKIKGDKDYNKKIDGLDVDIDYLYSLGERQSSSFDIEESGYTFNRTNEIVKNDYYDFRLGLTPDMQTAQKFTEFQTRKFGDAYSDGTVVMPQYENSFYFYFGLKDGSTAFDKFLTNFYSTCSSEKQVGEPRIFTTINNAVCEGSTITITVENMDYENGLSISLTSMETGTPIQFEVTQTNNVVTLSEIYTYGSATLIVTDSNGVSIKKSINIGSNIIEADTSIEDFKIHILNTSLENRDGTSDLSVYFYESYTGGTDLGGYISIYSAITCNSEIFTINDFNQNPKKPAIIVIEKNKRDNKYNYNYIGTPSDPSTIRTSLESIYTDGDVNKITSYSTFESDTIDTIKTFVWKVDTAYDLYFAYLCDSGYKLLKLTSYYFYGVDNFDLIMGSLESKALRYGQKNPDGFSLSGLTGDWWTNEKWSSISNNEVSSWLIKKCIVNEGIIPLTFNGMYNHGSFSGAIGISENDYSYQSSHVRCINNAGYSDTILYGTPENANRTLTTSSVTFTREGDNYSANTYNSEWNYDAGFDLDDGNFYWPSHVVISSDTTSSIKNLAEIKSGTTPWSYFYQFQGFKFPGKWEYQKMGYLSNDGNVISEKASVFNSISIDGDETTYLITLTYNANGNISKKGFENETLILEFEHNGAKKLISGIICKRDSIAQNITLSILTKDSLAYDDGGVQSTYGVNDFKNAYYTFKYPSIYRPFYVSLNTIIYTNGDKLYKPYYLDVYNGIRAKIKKANGTSCYGFATVLCNDNNGREILTAVTSDKPLEFYHNNDFHGYYDFNFNKTNYEINLSSVQQSKYEKYSYYVEEQKPIIDGENNSAWQEKISQLIPDYDTNSLWKSEVRSGNTTINFFDSIYIVDLHEPTGKTYYNEDGNGNSKGQYKQSKALCIHENITLSAQTTGDTNINYVFNNQNLGILKTYEYDSNFLDLLLWKCKNSHNSNNDLAYRIEEISPSELNTLGNFVTNGEAYSRSSGDYINFKNTMPSGSSITNGAIMSPLFVKSLKKVIAQVEAAGVSVSSVTYNNATMIDLKEGNKVEYSEEEYSATTTSYDEYSWAVFAEDGQITPNEDGTGVQYYFVSGFTTDNGTEYVTNIINKVQNFINTGIASVSTNGFISANPIKFSTLGECVNDYSINGLISEAFNTERNDTNQYSVDIELDLTETGSVKKYKDENRNNVIDTIKNYIEGITTDYNFNDNSYINGFTNMCENARNDVSYCLQIIGFDKELFNSGIRTVKIYNIKERSVEQTALQTFDYRNVDNRTENSIMGTAPRKNSPKMRGDIPFENPDTIKNESMDVSDKWDEMQTQYEGVSNSVSALTNSFSAITNSFNDLGGQFTSIRDGFSAATKDINNLQTAFSGVTKSVDDLKSSYDGLNSKIDDTISATTRITTQLEADNKYKEDKIAYINRKDGSSIISNFDFNPRITVTGPSYISVPKKSRDFNILIRGGFSYEYELNSSNSSNPLSVRLNFDNYRIKIALNKFNKGFILA